MHPLFGSADDGPPHCPIGRHRFGPVPSDLCCYTCSRPRVHDAVFRKWKICLGSLYISRAIAQERALLTLHFIKLGTRGDAQLPRYAPTWPQTPVKSRIYIILWVCRYLGVSGRAPEYLQRPDHLGICMVVDCMHYVATRAISRFLMQELGINDRLRLIQTWRSKPSL